MKLVVGFLKLHSKFCNPLLLYLQNVVFLALPYALEASKAQQIST